MLNLGVCNMDVCGLDCRADTSAREEKMLVFAEIVAVLLIGKLSELAIKKVRATFKEIRAKNSSRR